MIDPETVRLLPPGSVIAATEWAAFRLVAVNRGNRLWQVTGHRARFSDAEMIRHIEDAVSMGDLSVRVVREGDRWTGPTQDDAAALQDAVTDLLEDQVTRLTYGLGSSAAASIGGNARARFARNHPVAAALISEGSGEANGGRSPREGTTRRSGSPTESAP